MLSSKSSDITCSQVVCVIPINVQVLCLGESQDII